MVSIEIYQIKKTREQVVCKDVAFNVQPIVNMRNAQKPLQL